MFWNTYYEGTHLAPRQYGSLPSLRSNVKHLTAIEEFPHLYGKKNDRLETLHPDTKYYRRKLEIRAYAPSDLRKPLGDYYTNTVAGQVEKRADGKFLKSDRFQDFDINDNPGPKYNVNDKYTDSGYNGYSGYVAMSRPKDDIPKHLAEIPGPGTYDTVKQPFHNVSTSNFSKRAGRDDIVDIKQKWLGETPAPHDYNVHKSEESLRVLKLGKFNKSNREARNIDKTPGSLRYRPYDFQENEHKIGGLISTGDCPTADDMFVRKSSQEPAPHDYGNVADKSRKRLIGGYLSRSNGNFMETNKEDIPGPNAYGLVEPLQKRVQGGEFLKVDKFVDIKDNFNTPGPSDYVVNREKFERRTLGAPFGKLTESAEDNYSNIDSFHNPAPNQYVLPSVKSTISAPMLHRLEKYEDIRNRLQSEEPLFYDTRNSHNYLEPKPSYKMGNPSFEVESEISKFPGPDRYRLNPYATGMMGGMTVRLGRASGGSGNSFAISYNAPAARIRSRIEPIIKDQGGGGPGVCRSDVAFGKRAHAFPKLPSYDKVIMKREKPISPGPGEYKIDWHTIDKKMKQFGKGIHKAKVAKARISRWKWRRKNLF